LLEARDETGKWRRSTFCADGACVEIAEEGDRVLMRDAKNTGQQALDFDRVVWTHFMDDIKSEHFKLS